MNSTSGFGFGNTTGRKNWTSIQAEFLRDPQMQNSYSYARNNPINMKDPDGLWGVAVTAGGSAEVGPMIGGIGFNGNTGFAVAGDGFNDIEGGLISNTSNYAEGPSVQSAVGRKPYTGVLGGSAGLNLGVSVTNGKSLSSFQNSGQSVNISVGALSFQFSQDKKGTWTVTISAGPGAGYSMSSYPSKTLINGKSEVKDTKKKNQR